MSDGSPSDGQIPPPGEGANEDVPLRELADLAAETSAGFFARLRARISRRKLAAEVASFSWHLPVMVLVEFLNLILKVLGSRPAQKGGPQ